ncbi:uncharacterized protein LOC116237009 isoform X1 [Phasianus colchicus]|uniref:uncharacterized protein LOC116237009 isoform X1 n=1 Tax=Phasianus colchicus TaxID=9054 RepID=UPI00129E63EE|nr:uncharacterized protein LOC116237009 isoform X1 [Phasianus colchicus]
MEQVIKSLFAIIKDWLSDTNGEYSRKVWLLGKPKKEMETKPRRQTKSKSGKPGGYQPLLPMRKHTSALQPVWLVCVMVIALISGAGGAQLLPQPGNVWVTWANRTGQKDFCLSLQSATSPFRTCLIGIPQYTLEAFAGYTTNHSSCRNDGDLASQTACLIKSLNVSLPWDPQELDILGSQKVRNGSHNGTRTCITFGSVCWQEGQFTTCDLFDGVFNGSEGLEGQLQALIARWTGTDPRLRPYNETSWTIVSPTNTDAFSIQSGYCGYTKNETRVFTGRNTTCLSKGGIPSNPSNGSSFKCTAVWDFYGYGFSFKRGANEVLWNNKTAKALPPGIFLICGDRAWQGIPHNALGGPCYLGELTLLSPNFTTWMQYGPNVTSHRVKRSSPVPESCNDEVELWSATAQIFASFFAPGVAAAQSLAQIERLACWSAKQANLTTLVLNAMLEDTNSIRHAMLQDRAAIDFLLLAQGHGCEDLEGMCCFNLSDHSVSIHKALKALQDHSN